MKITTLKIENYRLLKNFELQLEDELSLIIGKNNTGKTSILSILEKFLSQSDKTKFHFNDFNNEFKVDLKTKIENSDSILKEHYEPLGIKLNIIIEYNAYDNLSNISKVMMDLDPLNTFIVLGFEYVLEYDEYLLLRKDIVNFSNKENGKIAKANSERKNYRARNFYDFLQQDLTNYFKLGRKSFSYDYSSKIIKKESYIDLIKEGISTKEIINFKYISAKREVTNKERNSTLSNQTSRIYKSSESTNAQTDIVEKFQDRLTETDYDLSNIYEVLFKDVIKKIKKFGGIKLNDSNIQIKSTLRQEELLEGNTTVIYKHDDYHQLPEYYNGLGYMNLISIIFEIEILIHEFKREQDKNPSDINLLFIEEPEAHTHPQMQYVFIKNIKELLNEGIRRKDEENRKLQYIISTHSSCIVADSNFDDIKYLKKLSSNSVIAKSLKDLKKEYTDNNEEQNFRFLKQYLTLNRAELFFADKAIFIEGDTERILLPAMMKKIDQEFPNNPLLLSQNISIIEVGAHSHIFEKFIDFIGIKGIIITDIDSYYQTPELEPDGITQKIYLTTGNPIYKIVKCSANDTNAKYTSNNSLIFFHKGEKGIAYFKTLDLSWKILRKNRKKKWVSNRKGYLLVLYQIEEDNYHARSFEDAFFKINKSFITASENCFPTLIKKHLDDYKNGVIDEFTLAEKGITSKPSLAIEILLNSKTDTDQNEFINWQIPAYIKEGLLWLKQD